VLSTVNVKAVLRKSAIGTAAAKLLQSPPNLQNSIVGFVLYEKLVYTDQGIVKSDDVISQFVLPPGGQVEVATKSWSKVSLDFEETQTQLTEEEKETSVSQNREISEATSKQEQYSMNLSTSIQGHGNWGAYKVASSAAASIGAAVNVARQESTKEKQEMTDKAASRARREHKLTIKRAAEFGTEIVRSEKFRNANKFQPVVYTFYKAAKEWEIRHEIHGVALCADVMVRNPGINLRQLLKPAFDPSTVPPLSTYYVSSDIAQEPPAIDERAETLDARSSKTLLPFAFVIPKGYTLDHVMGIGDKGRVTFGADPSGNRHDDMIPGSKMGLWTTDPNLRGHRVYNYKYPDGDRSSKITLTAYFRRKTELYDAWLQHADAKHKDNFKKAWLLEQDVAEASRRAFDEERATPVAQLLRQEERNELASGVARFLLTGVSDPEPLSDATAGSSTNLGPAAGRLIATIHHAFEWQNSSYFLYPYWWDFSVFGGLTVRDVLNVDHRDSIRKSFLQASWARILVPVTPGSEMTILVAMYGEGIRASIEQKLADNAFVPTQHAEIVSAYAALYKERTTGRFSQTDNMASTNPLDDSNVVQPAPIVLATWTEFTPTDETFAEMRIITDASGVAVNLGEPTAQQAEALQLDTQTALRDTIKDLKTKVQSLKISMDLGDGEPVTVEASTNKVVS